MSQQMWDERYSAPDRVWSGQPNPWLVEVADGLPPGAALDLGCGEGADAIWLARRGWAVTAVDFSPAGLARARSEAQAAAVAVDWVQADLAEWRTEQRFDFVSVQFLHGDPAARRRIHRLAWELTRGTLLIVGHDTTHPGPPPADVRYGTDEILSSLGLTGADPHLTRAERRSRGDARDCVVIARRAGAARREESGAP